MFQSSRSSLCLQQYNPSLSSQQRWCRSGQCAACSSGPGCQWRYQFAHQKSQAAWILRPKRQGLHCSCWICQEDRLEHDSQWMDRRRSLQQFRYGSSRVCQHLVGINDHSSRLTGWQGTLVTHQTIFKAKFAIETDDKLILDGLAQMTMKNSKNIRDFFGRLNKTNNIIMDGKHQYTLLPPKPVPQANGFLDTAEVDAYYETQDVAIGKFYLLNFFRAGLPAELKRVINLQSLDELDLYTAAKLTTIESRSREEAKSSSKIFAVDDDSEDPIDAVNFRQQRNSNQSQRGQNRNFRDNNRGATNNSNRGNPYSWRNPNQQQPGNNSTRNKQICVFCKIPNHRQEECRKRINANKPCLDTNGRPFWPKVNAAADATSGQNPAPIQCIEDFQFWAWWNPYVKLHSSFRK